MQQGKQVLIRKVRNNSFSDSFVKTIKTSSLREKLFHIHDGCADGGLRRYSYNVALTSPIFRR